MTLGSLAVDALRVAGVMSGTSCDGLDVACVEFDGGATSLQWRPLWSASASFPSNLRRRVLLSQTPGTRMSTLEWLTLDRDLGIWFASTLRRILKSRSPQPHVLANHGQTIAHFPGQKLTLQLGSPTLIAQTIGLSVVCGFREGDLAAGGQGAPLVPRFHRMLAQSIARPGKAIAIHNLGGISNLSYFDGSPRGLLAFDTGPGNLWIDAAAAHITQGKLRMDRGGRLARAGEVDFQALKALLKHPYFAKPAPKSTGRDEFAFELLLARSRAKGADLVATATALTVESVAQAYENEILRKGHRLDEIYFCGGGAKNPALLDGIARRLPNVVVRSIADASDRKVHYDPQLIEAQAFAYFGCLAVLGAPIGGLWTGAKAHGPPAHIIPAKNWPQVLSKLRANRCRSPKK